MAFVRRFAILASSTPSKTGRRRVVTASWDNTARVWDADTGEPVGNPMTHGLEVHFASSSPDDKRVAIASDDKTARVWNVFWSSLSRPDTPIEEEACQRKLRGNVRVITEVDVRAARILSHERVGEGCLRRRGLLQVDRPIEA